MILIGMISFTSCDSGMEQTNGLNTEVSNSNKEGDFVWVELENLEKREQITSTVNDFINNTQCSTCTHRCQTVGALNNHSWIVDCDDDTTYVATYCGGSWYISDQTWYVTHGGVHTAYNCK